MIGLDELIGLLSDVFFIVMVLIGACCVKYLVFR